LLRFKVFVTSETFSSTCFRALCSTDLQGKKTGEKNQLFKRERKKERERKKKRKETEEEDKKGFESALTVKPYRSLSHYFDVKTSLSVFLSVCVFFLSIVVCFSLSLRPFCFFFLLLFVSLCLCVRFVSSLFCCFSLSLRPFCFLFLLLFLSVFASVLIPLSFVVSLCLCVRFDSSFFCCFSLSLRPFVPSFFCCLDADFSLSTTTTTTSGRLVLS
jgi:hypothetical protein